MRQVDEAELIWVVMLALPRMPAAIRKDLSSGIHDRRRSAEQIAAGYIAQALRQYEVLSDAPLPPGTDLFSRAAYGGGETGAPMIEDRDRLKK